MVTLDTLPIGAKATVESVAGEPAVIQRLAELGLFEGENLEVIGFAPLGDPMEIRVNETRLSLRIQEARCISIASRHS
jgi:ferrous iron transport protein A